jgi:hypothetical protein
MVIAAAIFAIALDYTESYELRTAVGDDYLVFYFLNFQMAFKASSKMRRTGRMRPTTW